MLCDPDIDEALRYVDKAQRRLKSGERPENRAGTSPRRATRERLGAAGQELRALQSADQPDLSPVLSDGEPPGPDPARASQALGLLSLLRFQLEKTARQVEPLGPESDPSAPLRRLEEADLEDILSSLARLRRLASAMEAELRPLKQEQGGDAHGEN